MKKLKLTFLISIVLIFIFAFPANGLNISGHGNFDYNTMVSNSTFEGAIAINYYDFTAGLILHSYKAFPMMSKENPLSSEINNTCYLGQYFLEYKYKPFKLAFIQSVFRTDEVISKEDMPDFTYLREAFPKYMLGVYYMYEEDPYVLLGFSYNFNDLYTTEVVVEKVFWRFTFGARNVCYMYMVNKDWSVSGSPICQLYEVYIRLHLSNNTYIYFNDWCYHPVVSESRKSAYYDRNSHNPMGLSFGINFHF